MIARIVSLLVVATALTGGAGATQDGTPTAEALVESVAAAWDPVRVRLLAKMTVVSPGRPETETELLIRRAGSGRTRVDFMSPEKDRGKALLQSGSQTWLYLPRTGRVIEVPAKRSPLAGGVLFEDLFPIRDSGSESATVEVTGDAFILVDAAKKGTSRIFFDRSTLLPLRREVYSSSGRLLKTVQIEEMRPWQGAQIPWKIRFEDHLRKGAQARIEVLQATALGAEEETLISRERLAEPPAVEP